MKLSTDRQNYLARLITNHLLKQEMTKNINESQLLEQVKQGFFTFTKEMEDLNQEIKQKILSIKRGIHPNSSEWDVLYSRFLEESFRKKSRLFHHEK